MNIAIWVAQGLLALAFLVSGGYKMRPLRARRPMQGVSEAQTKIIGGLELLAAVGLILPAALNVVPVLTAAAAAGLVLLMIAAIAYHVRSGDTGSRVAVNGVLLLLALGVAWTRFGPYPV
jgi:uncharacterized membrane protein YphA (DoxX/SURF4 family)